MAAEVYSYRGLETYASLMERMNKLEDAEQTYKNIAERYEDWSALYLFYKRQQSYGRALGAKALEMEKAVFPRGIEEVTVASFTGAPKRGVVINEENDVLRTTGLNAGDIIVAFDGKRVETMEQYFFIRALSENPTFRLIAYHKGEYKEYAVSLKDRRFGVDMATLE